MSAAAALPTLRSATRASWQHSGMICEKTVQIADTVTGVGGEASVVHHKRIIAFSEHGYQYAHRRWCAPAQAFGQDIHSGHLAGDVDALRTMAEAFATRGALRRLTFAGNRTVVAREKTATGFGIVLCIGRLRHRTLIEAFVVMREYTRNVQPIGTRHAILAFDAGNGGKFGQSDPPFCAERQSRRQ